MSHCDTKAIVGQVPPVEEHAGPEGTWRPWSSSSTGGARGRRSSVSHLCGPGPAESEGGRLKTHAAVLWGREQDWQIEEIDLDPPECPRGARQMGGGRTVPLRRASASRATWGRRAATGDPRATEARGILPHGRRPRGGGRRRSRWARTYDSLQLGDHVAASFFPICGRCRMCITGHSNLCDLGAATFAPGQISDGTIRYHLDGQDLNVMSKLGTFAEHSVAPRGVAGEGRARPAAPARWPWCRAE